MQDITTKEKIKKAIENNLTPILLIGAPGVGKTQRAIESSKELGYDVLVFHPVVDSPIDYKGLPAVVEGQAKFLPYDNLEKIIEATKPTIVVLDDLGQASMAVQAAVMQLLLARELNGKKISNHVQFIACTNDWTHGAGVKGLLSPLVDRFVLKIEVNFDLKEWTVWAMQNDIAEELIQFINYKPSILTQEFTTKMLYPVTPRSIEFASKAFKVDPQLMAHVVGQGFFEEFNAFRLVYQNLPKYENIVKQPSTCEVPTSPDKQVLVINHIVHHFKSDDLERVLMYIKRFSASHQVLWLKMLQMIDHPVIEDERLIDWALKEELL